MKSDRIKEAKRFFALQSKCKNIEWKRIEAHIRIAPLSEVFDEETIKLIKTQIRPEPKLCFKNATLLCTMFPDRVKYVEGKFTVAHTISTEHAWNKVGDKYIDITMEIALECNPAEEEYIALGEYDESEILPYLFESKVYGGIYEQKFLEDYGSGKTILLVPDGMKLELAWDSLKPISLYDNPEDKRNFNRRVDDYVYYRNLSKGRNTKSTKYFINQKDL